VALWIDTSAVAGMLALIGVAAVLPAIRAGRFSAAQAISLGRAPRAGHGLRVRRLLAATRLPVPVRFGLGTAFARPARTAVTLVAVLLGALTVVFAAGLTSSLQQVAAAADRTAQVQVEVGLSGSGVRLKNGVATPIVTDDPAAVRRAVLAAPGTAHVVGVRYRDFGVVGYGDQVSLSAYDGDPTWLGFQLLSGRWYAGPDEVVAGSGFLRATGHEVGDTLTLVGDSATRTRTVRIVGAVFDLDSRGIVLISGITTLTPLTDNTDPDRLEVGLTPNTDPHAYIRGLEATVGNDTDVSLRGDGNTVQTFAILIGLIATLTLSLSVVAALGVFNTVLLNAREQVAQIGVLKTLGMTPRQVRTMVVASMTGIGLVAGVVALPLGTLLHRQILPVMADAAGTAIPATVLDVYRPAELALLGAAGVVLAVLGAMVPAGFAAHARIATALRAE
jgi:putative ABC transport system permease protein